MYIRVYNKHTGCIINQKIANIYYASLYQREKIYNFSFQPSHINKNFKQFYAVGRSDQRNVNVKIKKSQIKIQVLY